MSQRLVILTEIISPYRIPVFNVLAKHRDIDLHVIFLSETDPVMRGWQVYKNEMQFSYEVLPSYRKRLRSANILVNRRVHRALRSARPDVIVCGGYNYPASWQALFWARRNLVTFVLWSESTEKDKRRSNPIIEILKRFFITRCSKFVVPGKASFQYLLSFSVPQGKIFTAPNAVDNELFREAATLVRTNEDSTRLQLKLPKRYFLFVGRIVREKGVFDLLESYRNLSSEIRGQMGLVFAGDGPDRDQLMQLARSVSPSHIVFPGFVHREALGAYYALADVLVLPTHSDTWGLTVNEGMACGVCVVCADVAGCVPDLVQDGWNGYVLPAEDTDQMTRVLEKLARNPETIREMGDNSAQRILAFSPQACAQGIAGAVASFVSCS